MKRARKAVPAGVPHEDWLLKQLQDSELAAAYLNAALAEGDQATFMLALRDVAKARGGVAAVARQAGLNRVSLNRALSERGNPELHSLNRILEVTGFKLMIVSRDKKTSPRRPRTRRISIKTGHVMSASRRIDSVANKPVLPIPNLQTEVSQGDGGVQRIVYSDKGQTVGSARLLAWTIGDIEVVKEKQRQGYGLRILADLYARGGRTAVAVSKAGAGLMQKAGMRDLGNGRFGFPDTTP